MLCTVAQQGVKIIGLLCKKICTQQLSKIQSHWVYCTRQIEGKICTSFSIFFCKNFNAIYSNQGVIVLLDHHFKAKMWKHESSVTRFGEISLIWQHFKSLWHQFESLLSLGQNFEIAQANCFVVRKIFIVINGQKMNK